MTVTTCTRRMTLDAGHRVPGHGGGQGQCASPHGHTYTVEVTVAGDVAADGMILDFGILKVAMMEEVHAYWDHAFLVWDQDETMLAALATDPTWKIARLSLPPTAENLAYLAGVAVSKRLLPEGIQVTRVRVQETPNCYAEVEGP